MPFVSTESPTQGLSARNGSRTVPIDDGLTQKVKQRMTDPQYLSNAKPLDKAREHAYIDLKTLAATWFHGQCAIATVHEKLMAESKPNGSFVIRQRGSTPTLGFALHLKYDGQIFERDILASNGAVHFPDSEYEFPNLAAFVYYYSDPLKQYAELPYPLLVTDRDSLKPPQSPITDDQLPTFALNGDNDNLDERAGDNEPWKVADVCDWLEELDFSQYIPVFRSHRIDGIRLLDLDVLDLLQLGVAAEDAPALVDSIRSLQAQTIAVDGEVTNWRRRTLVVKELDGEIKLFDADTGEEVHHLADEITRQLIAAGRFPRLSSNMEAAQDAETEFAWVGDTKGWMRRLRNGRLVFEAEWTGDDLAAWLQHVNLGICIPVFETLNLTVKMFKGMDPEEQEQLGQEYGIGDALIEAWRLFNLRVFPNGKSYTQQRSPQAAAALQLMPQIDAFAQQSPWCRLDEPKEKAGASLMEYAPANAFVVVRDPQDATQLILLVVVPPFGLKEYRILTEDTMLRLENTRYLCQDLSELVHIFASDNEDKAWLLNLETPIDDYLNRVWFHEGLETATATARLQSQPVGSFVVYPADFQDVFVLTYVSTEGVESKHILARTEGYQLEGISHQVFQTLTDLINHYTFVRNNDLGTVLLQNPADFLANVRHEHAPWFRPHMTRQDAEAALAGLHDGAFLVRHATHSQAKYILSYVFNGVVHHMIIDQDSEGLTYFRESAQAFKSLSNLVEYYCAQPSTDLLCQLVNPLETSVPPQASLMTPSMPVSADVSVPLDPIFGHGEFPWLKLNPITKSQALATLIGKPNGAFVVRSSERAPNYLSLSYVFGDHIHHELVGIMAPETDGDSGVYLLRVPDRIFETIYDLVAYYKLNAGELLCALVEVETTTTPSRVREKAPWLVTGMPRDDAVSLLEGKPPGSFIIRESQSSAGYLVLCLMDTGNVILQEYIEMLPGGFCLEKARDLLFPTLHDLVQYYSEPRPELPCALVLYDIPLWHEQMQTTTAPVSVASRQPEETLTLESQHATSMRVRSKPDLFREDDERYYIQHAGPHSDRLTAMRSDRTLKWRTFAGQSLHSRSSDRLFDTRVQSSQPQHQRLSQAALLQQQSQFQHGSQHSRHHQRIHRTSKSKSVDSNLFGKREDTVKRTCRELGLYTNPEQQSWYQPDRSLNDIKHMLRHQGDFVVHRSPKGFFARLSMLHLNEIVSRDIVEEDNQLYLQHSRERFISIPRLIEYYVHPAQTDLPACLGRHSV
eukprot:m.7312 g.7312  ORF g.7312 m.7312 type:complete len:1252 (+) comp5162_c0_seq1:52-3807(+)